MPVTKWSSGDIDAQGLSPGWIELPATTISGPEGHGVTSIIHLHLMINMKVIMMCVLTR